MSVSVVFGGQFGSEGKGKVARYFANKLEATSVVRVGGVNSGHTVINSDGATVVFRMLPTAVVNGNVNCILPAGSYIDVDILLQEIERSSVPASRVKIHPNAAVITQTERFSEMDIDLHNRIGSTLSGTGGAVKSRVSRAGILTLAKDVDVLQPFITDTSTFLREELNQQHHVLIEGTQGFGLSVLHSPYYPFATSRDTSAAGFVSEAGLSPFDVKYVIMVIRSFPIRVGGNSGPLPDEITWDEVSDSSISGMIEPEYTSVTKIMRRVARFNPDIVRQAIAVNQPNIVVLNHCDYFDYKDTGKPVLGAHAKSCVDHVRWLIGQSIDYVGNGADVIIPYR